LIAGIVGVQFDMAALTPFVLSLEMTSDILTIVLFSVFTSRLRLLLANLFGNSLFGQSIISSGLSFGQ
jgi:hypothetical protein